MNTNEFEKAKKLFICMGNIDETILDEAETADIPSETAARKRKHAVRYGALAAAASVGVAVTYWLIRSRRLAVKGV